MTAIDWDVRIVQGSSELIDLNTAPVKILDWVPSAPRSQIIRQRSTGEEDKTRKVRLRPAVETMTLILRDTDYAANLAELEKIKRGLTLAREAQEHDDHARVFIEVRKVGGGDWYRSEIITGAVQEDPDTMKEDWIRNVMFARLTFTRRFFWEQTTGDAMTVVNGSGSGTTRVITNHDDGGEDNWVTVTAAQIKGDLAVHPEIALLAGDAGVTIRRVYLGVMRGSTANVVFLEAEDGTNEASSSDAADANSSNGNYVTSTWAVSAETHLFTFDLTAAHAKALGGRWCKMMMRFQAAVGDSTTKLRLKLVHGSNLLWEGEQLLLHTSDFLQDMGDMKIPPWEREGSSADVPDLGIQVWGQKSGGTTVKIDYLFPMPKDGFRFYEPIAGGLYYSSDEAFLYDTFEEGVYTQIGGAAGTKGVIPNYIASGEPIELLSNLASKWWWLWDRSDGTAPIADVATVKLTLKHRRTTL